MTARLVFLACLTEVTKTGAPSMLLEDFNYYINKAINQYGNKQYNMYDMNLLTTDSLRVLKSEAVINEYNENDNPNGLKHVPPYGNYSAGHAPLFDATYEFNLPTDYWHMLNCVCVYRINKNTACYDKNNIIPFSAKRLTADSWSAVINDYYTRPLPERPYYYIHHVNPSNIVPTNPYDNGVGTDMDDNYKVTPELASTTHTTEYEWHKDGETNNEWSNTSPGDGWEKTGNYRVLYTTHNNQDNDKSNFKRTLTVNFGEIDAVEKEAAHRYGNASNVRCEIRYGHDTSVYELVQVRIDYIKVPQYIRLTQEQVNLTEDTSLIMEFPDYVCLEIINELVMLVLEKNGDPRLLTHMAVSQSIGSPVQQLTQSQAPTQQRRSS